MANDFPTVADSLADALDLSEAQVSDLEDAAPLVARLPAETSSNGTTHKYSKETAAPVVGFRAENVGRDFDHGADSIVTATLTILDWSWAADKAVADVWRKGGREAYIAMRGFRHVKAALKAYQDQLINGTGADSGGFNGFADASTVDALADRMVVDAGGTTADTASSFWAIRVGIDDVSAVVNGDETIAVGETPVQNFVDGSGGNLPIYYTPGTTWLGCQVGSAFSLGRIVNLTEDSGKGLTDDLVYDLLSQFPTDR